MSCDSGEAVMSDLTSFDEIMKTWIAGQKNRPIIFA